MMLIARVFIQPLVPVAEWVLRKLSHKPTLEEAEAAKQKLQSQVHEYPSCIALGTRLRGDSTDNDGYVVTADFQGEIPQGFPTKINRVDVWRFPKRPQH